MDRRSGGALIVLLALAAWLYSPMLAAPFVWQDADYRGLAVGWAFPGRGLARWTWARAADSASAHALNIGLHLMNGALVALVASRVIAPVAAVCAAGVFLLHPLNSESVAYATGRADLLVTLFALLAVYGALRGGWWRVLMALALVGAAVSKEIGVIAVGLVVLTLAIWRPQCRPSSVGVAVLCGLGGLLIGAMWAQFRAWSVFSNGSPWMDWPTFAVVQLVAIWDLLLRAVWLGGYSIDHDPVAVGAGWRWLCVLLTVQAVALMVWAWRRAPVLAWSLAWIAACLGPRLIFADYEFITEYKFSTAMVGVSVLMGSALARLVPVSAPQWRERVA